MKIAILGVGLIGGSIGLAARRRLEAEVAGFDPANAERALELGALDHAVESAADAVADADVVFCAAPVGAITWEMAKVMVKNAAYCPRVAVLLRLIQILLVNGKRNISPKVTVSMATNTTQK